MLDTRTSVMIHPPIVTRVKPGSELADVMSYLVFIALLRKRSSAIR